MSANAKRWLISLAIVIVMLFWVDPAVVNWIWSAFPPSAADWGKVIRFIPWLPVLSISFWVSFFLVGIFLSVSIAKENKARMDAFKAKHNFPKSW